MAAKLKLHPLCEQFPEMPDDEFKEFVEDMRVNGQRDPIHCYNNVVLDGKHRLKACEILGREPETRKWHPTAGEPEEPQIRAFVLSRNFYRRQLQVGQRAIVAAEFITTAGPGRPRASEKNDVIQAESGKKELGNISQLSQGEAAAAAGVSTKSVNQAAKVLDSGSKALVDAVKTGEVSVSDAVKVVDLPKTEQTAAVKKVKSGEAKTVTKAAGREPGEDKPDPIHDETIKDQLGALVPKKLRRTFAELKTFGGIVQSLGKLQSKIEDLQRSDAGFAIPINEILKAIPVIQNGIKFAKPYCECPKCRRKVAEECAACSGVGWITEATWKRCKTKEDEEWLKSR